MTSPILFAGGEDLDFQFINNTFGGTSPGLYQFGNVTTAGSFRAGYARYALGQQMNGGGAANASIFIRAFFNAASSQFWATYRMGYNCQAGTATNVLTPLRFVDANGILRLMVKFTGSFGAPNDTFNVYTVNAAGTQTQIGSTSLARFSGNTGAAGYTTPDKVDVFVNYASSGQITIYLNGTQTFTYSGNLLTDSNTTLQGMDLGEVVFSGSNANFSTYSEVIVSTADTRNCPGLVTQAPTANGNTHNWDSGTAANLASTTMTTGDVTPNYATTAGLIEEYQVTPALPSGNFTVLTVVQKARAAIGTSGPSKFEFMVRTGGSDFTSTPDSAPGLAWSTLSYNWDVNPNTGVAWTTGDLINSSTLFNMGLKSVT